MEIWIEGGIRRERDGWRDGKSEAWMGGCRGRDGARDVFSL